MPMLDFLPAGAVVLAPLSGYGDLPFRRTCRQFGMMYAFAPMVDASALAIGSRRTRRIAERGPEEEWFGVQVVGNNPEKIAAACEWLETLEPDVVDLNLGCPAPKVRRKGQDCAMLDFPDLVHQCVETMVQVTHRPVTVKTRLTASATAEPVIEVARAAAEAGARAMTVHARPPRQRYGGPVHLEVLAEIIRGCPIPVIGNGGIYSRYHLEQMRRIANPHAFMVARGAMGAPWLFAHLEGPDPWEGGTLPEEPVADPPPTPQELVRVIREHAEATVEYHGRERGYARNRKLVLRYLKGRGLPSETRVAASHLETREDLEDLCGMIRAAPRILGRFA